LHADDLVFLLSFISYGDREKIVRVCGESLAYTVRHMSNDTCA